MQFSAPIYRLKRRARLLSRDEKIPLTSALDRIAREEGFARWSLLAAKAGENPPAREIFKRLTPGDLVLLAARPGQGKTLLGIELALEALRMEALRTEALRSRCHGAFFTLEYTGLDLLSHLEAIGIDRAAVTDRFLFDDSDAISASYIMDRLTPMRRGTVAVIDYLQLLDQKRENPPLMTQIRDLKDFAHRQGIIIAFLSQIDRTFDGSAKSCPGLADIRLPNPLDLTLFDIACFLHEGQVRIERTA